MGGVRGDRQFYVVGDWVDKEGLVSNAYFASAKRAAQLNRPGGRPNQDGDIV